MKKKTSTRRKTSPRNTLRKSETPTRTEPKKNARELFRSELEIPVKDLLTHKDELDGARRIGSCVSRLRALLPRHPLGYRRFLSRMHDMSQGTGTLFAWHAMKNKMAADLASAEKALARAEKQVAKQPAAAGRTFERGVKVLETYPLDPETLYQWSKEVVQSKRPIGPLADLERIKKTTRILAHVMYVLDRERDRLVMPNLRLVMREVFRFPPKGMQESDLFQEGFLGLNKAVFRFDPGRELRFSTYATHWIRQSIRKALIDKSSLIRLPQALHEKRYRKRRNLTEKELAQIRQKRGSAVLFSALNDDEDDSSFDVKDPRPSNVTETLHTAEIPKVVREALQRLSESEQEVVLKRFGLAGAPSQTLEEIGSQMQLSRERIRQIEKGALKQMREFRELMETYDDLSKVETLAIA